MGVHESGCQAPGRRQVDSLTIGGTIYWNASEIPWSKPWFPVIHCRFPLKPDETVECIGIIVLTCVFFLRIQNVSEASLLLKFLFLTACFANSGCLTPGVSARLERYPPVVDENIFEECPAAWRLGEHRSPRPYDH